MGLGIRLACWLVIMTQTARSSVETAAPGLAFPAELKALTSLRYLAALWVVVFHFRPYAGVEAVGVPVLYKGYLAVDFFFILSGFVLAHVYRSSLREGTYSHRAFVIKRLARVYPMHAVTLAFFVALALAAPVIGLQLDSAEKFDMSQIVPQIFLVHAWLGTGETFNYPSWSISAEFLAYLSFPLVMILAGRPRMMLAAGVIATFGWYFAALEVAGDVSTHLPDWRPLRILPEFLLGAGLREVMGRYRVTALYNTWSAPLLILVVLGLAAIDMPDWVLLLAMIALIAAAAERGRSGADGILEHPFSTYLGEISYALYMVHVAVGMAMFELVGRVFGEAEHVTAFSSAMMVLGLVIATIVAALAERMIERPGRRLIARLARPIKRTAQTADARAP